MSQCISAPPRGATSARRDRTAIRHALGAGLAAAALSMAMPAPATAALTLTAQGQALGFTLSTFASGLPSPCCGYAAWGSATLSNGRIVMNGYNQAGQTVNYVWSDVDGQTPATALSVNPWNDGGYASALVRVGGAVYGTHYSDNTVRVVNLDGSEGDVVSNVGRGGLGASSQRNSLIAATDLGLVEIDLGNPDPATNYRVIGGPTGFGIDGVTVSLDGQTAYAEASGHIYGYNIASGAQTYDSGFIGSPDGVGVVTAGTLAGRLITNGNEGAVYLLDPTGINSIVTLATGGSRGDYTGFDLNNGTLFLSQSDSLLRLSLAGGSIGGGGDPVDGGIPEPATWALMIMGLGAAGAALRRKRLMQMA
jgi:hypothetical protein